MDGSCVTGFVQSRGRAGSGGVGAQLGQGGDSSQLWDGVGGISVFLPQ